MKDSAVLHIYGQEFEHTDAVILGNRRGLRALKKAITNALKGTQDKASVFASDGEGYYVRVMEVDEATSEKLAVPYTDPSSRDAREDTIRPVVYFDTIVLLDSKGRRWLGFMDALNNLKKGS